MRPVLTHLTTEYKTNPLGMDEPCPRFSWRAEGTGAALQTARRIVVRDEAGATLWDSDFVAAGDSVLIPYAGDPLRPFTRYFWRAEARFDDGATAASEEEAFFETGYLGTPWAASKWITAASGQGERRPATRLARELEIAKSLRRARLYATALGLYVPFVNGVRATDNRLAPGWTQYEKRVQYQAYDVTALLHPGANALAALLGDGWYCGTISRIATPPGVCGWGWTPQFRAELRLEYADGSVETIGTDTSWSSFYLHAAVQGNDLYHGEEYDATVDDEFWKLPGFRPRASAVREGGEDAGEIVWNSGAEVRVVRELRAVSRTRRPSGVWQLDFGENVSGVERLTFKAGHPGAVVAVRHGEALDADGDLWCANLAFARQLTLVTCGKKPFTYAPDFTCYGFRYLEVSGWPEEMDDDSVVVEVLSSAARPTGFFASSNPLLDQFFANAARSQQDNFVDLPTDCPQRCERCGWTGDAQVFAETALMNFDCGAFFTKWIADLYASRTAQGTFRTIVPFPPGAAKDGGEKPWGLLGWSDAGVVCPWMLYRKCGDRRILEICFDGAARYVRNQDEAGDEVRALGDHLALGANTPTDFLGQALRIEMMRLVAEMARVLGRDDDARPRPRRRRAPLHGAPRRAPRRVPATPLLRRRRPRRPHTDGRRLRPRLRTRANGRGPPPRGRLPRRRHPRARRPSHDRLPRHPRPPRRPGGGGQHSPRLRPPRTDLLPLLALSRHAGRHDRLGALGRHPRRPLPRKLDELAQPLRLRQRRRLALPHGRRHPRPRGRRQGRRRLEALPPRAAPGRLAHLRRDALRLPLRRDPEPLGTHARRHRLHLRHPLQHDGGTRPPGLRPDYPRPGHAPRFTPHGTFIEPCGIFNAEKQRRREAENSGALCATFRIAPITRMASANGRGGWCRWRRGGGRGSRASCGGRGSRGACGRSG